jgi:hypothetical protein
LFVALSLHCYLSGAYSEAIAAATRVATLAPDTGIDQRLRAACIWPSPIRRAGIIVARSTASRRWQHFSTGRLAGRIGVSSFPLCSSLHIWRRATPELGTFAEGTAMGSSGLEIAEAVDHPMSHAFAAWGRFGGASSRQTIQGRVSARARRKSM